jgi:hypothetical protein
VRKLENVQIMRWKSVNFPYPGMGIHSRIEHDLPNTWRRVSFTQTLPEEVELNTFSTTSLLFEKTYRDRGFSLDEIIGHETIDTS